VKIELIKGGDVVKVFVFDGTGSTNMNWFDKQFFLWWISNKKKHIKIVENHLMNIPTKFGSNWPTGFRDNQHAKA
jgi:hypothetical protein